MERKKVTQYVNSDFIRNTAGRQVMQKSGYLHIQQPLRGVEVWCLLVHHSSSLSLLEV